MCVCVCLCVVFWWGVSNKDRRGLAEHLGFSIKDILGGFFCFDWGGWGGSAVTGEVLLNTWDSVLRTHR